MAHITVIGATGYAGAAVVAEAARRGHAVTGVSRRAPAHPVEGVTYVEGSALEPGVQARAFEGADVVVSATSPRGDMATRQLELSRALAERAADSGVRLIVVGGFSSLRPAAGAPRIIEGGVPEQYRTEAEAGHSVLEMLLGAPDRLDWTFVSPAATFGAYAPGTPTGAYRLGGEVAQLDADGKSFVSAHDFALAIVDLAEAEAGKGHVSVVA
jgi:hypothetical protein